MRDSMQKHLRAGLLASICGSGLLMAGCGGNDNASSPPTPAAPTTTALAVSQIDTQTCDSNEPQDVNGLSLSDDQDDTDVTMLTPGCSAH